MKVISVRLLACALALPWGAFVLRAEEAGAPAAAVEKREAPKAVLYVKNLAGADNANVAVQLQEQISAMLTQKGLEIIDLELGPKVEIQESSVLAKARLAGANYVVLTTLNPVTSAKLGTPDNPLRTFSFRAGLEIKKANGGSLCHETIKVSTRPMPEGGMDLADAIPSLIEQAAEKLAAKFALMPPPGAADQVARVGMAVTLDGGLKNAVVKVDGVVVGSAPGTLKVAPGLHVVKVSRELFKDWTETVDISDGLALAVPMEMTDDAINRYAKVKGIELAIARAEVETAIAQKQGEAIATAIVNVSEAQKTAAERLGKKDLTVKTEGQPLDQAAKAADVVNQQELTEAKKTQLENAHKQEIKADINIH